MLSSTKLVSKKKSPYPCLKTPTNTTVVTQQHSYVVLFHAPKAGVVVWEDQKNSPHRVGSYSGLWAEEMFELFDGAIELTNAT